MSFTTFITCFLAMGTTGWAQYVLEDDYLAGGNFFDQFSFWDSADPTDGFVEYQGQSAASSQKLINSSASNVEMRVDSTNNAPSGRASVRITSNKAYQSGLFILDADHMPTGCGTWPAFWLVGPNWPSGGEIDIIEGVNEQSGNAMTLHTGSGCSITNNDAFSGSISTSNCDVNAAGFNANNGGVYATEWTSSAISIYFFPRGSIPSDITSGSPEPSSWGKPLAQFQGGCDIPSFFSNQQIVFDTTLCGAWAGAVWSSGSCASKAATCNSFVANNPSAFTDAFWSINALKVYQSGGSTSTKVVSTTAAGYSPSVSVAAPSGTSVWAANYSPSASPTTFALSSKASAPIFPTSAPATSPSSVSVAAVPTSSTSVWAASYNSSASPSTFVLSSKTLAPISPTGAPATPPYSIGNSTDSSHLSSSGTGLVSAPFPSGTNHVSAPYPSGTGTLSAPPSLSSTGLPSTAPAAVSPPTIISAASAPSAAPSSPSESSVAAQPATSSNIPTQSYDWQTRSWTHHHHYTPVPQAVRRHLKGHKRHGGGLF
ncbi:hypothetical protein LTR01_004592 [Friedmanniomyces endolithicus]|nr:hypothetical protein LTR01_004592 [Friedmanniomyces endolithicus]KAK0823534.1 hypothetical protein LTR73_008437 [Friedmanniomyces endolithicus]